MYEPLKVVSDGKLDLISTLGVKNKKIHSTLQNNQRKKISKREFLNITSTQNIDFDFWYNSYINKLRFLKFSQKIYRIKMLEN